MRILLISHTCQSLTEGQPKAEELAKIPGIELCVLTPDRWKHYGTWRSTDQKCSGSSYELHIGKVRCPWLGPVGYYLHWYPELAKLIKSFRPDIIDLWEEPWALVSAQACMLRDKHAPDALVLSETEQNISKVLPPPFQQFRSYTLSNADWAIGRSDEAVDVLRAKNYHGPASVVPNAVDSKLFRPMNKQNCKSQLGLAGFVVGFVGRLVEEKGVEDLMDMLDYSPANVSLVFAGEGPLMPALKARAQRTGKTDRVRFLGNLAPKDLAPVLNAIDVLALPSRSTASWREQFGRVIIEAHACGTPVIGSNSGAIPKVVGEGGIIVPERSAKALANAVSALLGDSRLTRELGESGLAQVHAKYTWETIASKMADIYERMLARDAAAVPYQSERVLPTMPELAFTKQQ